MTSTEQLIEAAEYAVENGMSWWEVFDSPVDAMKVLRSAQHEDPDEGQIACLMSAVNSEDSFADCTFDRAYKNTLRLMKKELEEVLEE